MVGKLHDRMPVVLAEEHFEAWLDVEGTAAEEAAALLVPAPEEFFEAVELDPKINNSRNDASGIQEPLQKELLF